MAWPTIAATIFVERDSQRGSSSARRQNAEVDGSAAPQGDRGNGGRKVFLELRVKCTRTGATTRDALKQSGT